jgi:adenylate cyclase
MAENADHRKLAAILCADVKGYSKLMGEDESYTVGALKERRKLFAENIQNHGGRVVNAPGDSILAEFPSVVSAVQCAVEIQTHINDRNAELPDNRKMVFRIGVNLGDVIESEDAIYGDGVNIAARIEAWPSRAECLFPEPYSTKCSKNCHGYEYQGEHQVKNITNPVKVYKLLTAPEDAGKMVGMEPTSFCEQVDLADRCGCRHCCDANRLSSVPGNSGSPIRARIGRKNGLRPTG